MEQFIFEDDVYNKGLTKKDMKIGAVYLAKDGRIMIYLGQTNSDRLVFYECMKVMIISYRDKYDTLANYTVTMNSIFSVCKELMQRLAYPESVIIRSGMPKILTEFPYINFEAFIRDWYAESLRSNRKLPTLKEPGAKPTELLYVKSAELVPGKLYYSGSCFRSVYIYVGRTSKKDYLWYFVDNEDEVVKYSAEEIIEHCEPTRQNKKVRKLEDALKDPKAYVTSECKKLIRSQFSVDLSGFSQNYIDKFAGIKRLRW